MRFNCAKSDLNDAVSVCIHAVSPKPSTPALEGLLISATEQYVTFSGFNYKTSIQRTFEASITEPGDIVVTARILNDIIRKLPGDTVEVMVDDRLVCNIKCGSTEFNILAYDSTEFPEVPTVHRSQGIEIRNRDFKDLINGTIFAVCENENKPIITGSLFEVENDLIRMISVDGYRLAVRQVALAAKPDDDVRRKFVVPGDTLKEIARILPDDDEICYITPLQKMALFEFGETQVSTRLLEGEFLNWRSAIPNDQPILVKINKAEVVEAVERVSLIISERLKNPVRCLFENEMLKLTCITALGRSYDECRIPNIGTTVEIGFNNRYLLDALRGCPDDEFILGLKSSLSPCTMTPVEGDKFTYLILPVRLKPGEQVQ